MENGDTHGRPSTIPEGDLEEEDQMEMEKTIATVLGNNRYIRINTFQSINYVCYPAFINFILFLIELANSQLLINQG